MCAVYRLLGDMINNGKKAQGTGRKVKKPEEEILVIRY
jgi:hypothetical protein